jgi:hypothetical protein
MKPENERITIKMNLSRTSWAGPPVTIPKQHASDGDGCNDAPHSALTMPR